MKGWRLLSSFLYLFELMPLVNGDSAKWCQQQFSQNYFLFCHTSSTSFQNESVGSTLSGGHSSHSSMQPFLKTTKYSKDNLCSCAVIGLFKRIIKSILIKEAPICFVFWGTRYVWYWYVCLYPVFILLQFGVLIDWSYLDFLGNLENFVRVPMLIWSQGNQGKSIFRTTLFHPRNYWGSVRFN